jgi:hypothetical protein
MKLRKHQDCDPDMLVNLLTEGSHVIEYECMDERRPCFEHCLVQYKFYYQFDFMKP